MAFNVTYEKDPYKKLDVNEEITLERYNELRGKVPIAHLMTVALRQITVKVAEAYAEQMKLKAEAIGRAHEFSSNTGHGNDPGLPEPSVPGESA